MSKWDNPYSVFETLCFPAKWKVGRFEEDDNSTINYFRCKSLATIEADKRNKKTCKLHVKNCCVRSENPTEKS